MYRRILQSGEEKKLKIILLQFIILKPSIRFIFATRDKSIQTKDNDGYLKEQVTTRTRIHLIFRRSRFLRK